MRLQLFAQRLAIDAEDLCGSRAVAVHCRQNVADVLDFYLGKSASKVLDAQRRKAHERGQIGRFYDLGIRHDDEALDHVLQLPDIAGPVVLAKDAQHLVGETRLAFAELLRKLPRKVVSQDEYVVAPFTERGHRYADHVQAKI